MNRERFLSGFLFWGAVAVCLLLGFKYLLPAFLPFLVGGLLAALLRPVALGVQKVTRMTYKASAFVAVLFFFLVGGSLLWWLGSLLFSQASALFSRLPQMYLQTIQPALTRLGERCMEFLASFAPGASQQMGGFAAALGGSTQELLTTGSAAVLSAIGGCASHLPSLLVACSFALLSTFFILMDYPLVAEFLRRQLPAPLFRPVREAVTFLTTTGKNVIKAYFLIMVITFTEISLGLWLLRQDYFLVAGLVVAVLDILPVIGSGAILIPWGVYLLAANQPTLGVGILLLYGVVSVVRTIIEPKILGNQIGLHPLVTIISMYVGMKAGGFGGLILAPIIVTLFIHLDRQGHFRFFQ